VALIGPKSGDFGLLNPFDAQYQPGKENHAQIARSQIAEAEGAAGKITLRELFKPNQERKDQVADNSQARWALKWDRVEESQVDEQGQDPVKDEMSGFVSKGNLVDRLKNSKLAQVGQDNDENNKKREENREPLHKKRDALERLFHFASFFCSDFTPRF